VAHSNISSISFVAIIAMDLPSKHVLTAAELGFSGNPPPQADSQSSRRLSLTPSTMNRKVGSSNLRSVPSTIQHPTFGTASPPLPLVVWSRRSGVLWAFAAANVTLDKCGKEDFELLYVTARSANGVTLLGEADKLVPHSPMRFSQLGCVDVHTVFMVRNALGECIGTAVVPLPG
jgi:hypothetical protein